MFLAVFSFKSNEFVDFLSLQKALKDAVYNIY